MSYVDVTSYSNCNNNTHLMAIFQDNLSKPVPEGHHSGFDWSKYDGGDG